MIDIQGIDKAELLAALVNAAQPMGRGIFQDSGKPMTKEEAQKWIDSGRSHDGTRGNQPHFGDRKLYFDYVHGRPIKCDLSGDQMEEVLYDLDHGDGAAARVVAQFRK